MSAAGGAGEDDGGLSCPLPLSEHPRILLAHGGGGRLMQQLIERLFLPAFDNPLLGARGDSAVIALDGIRVAFTTDSYVVQPLFFPGGDIGHLAVYGTVNDLAMCGARPKWLSVGFILEEGLPMATLERIVASMRAAARACAVELVTGDTKVVERGRGDGVYVNTAGIGVIEHGLDIGPRAVRAGDAVLLSGDLGRHGIAVMASREGLEFDTTIESDLAPLHGPVLALIDAGIDVHCLRDLTRGGLTAALHEIAATADCGIELDETAIPVHADVAAACELLGLEPLQVANEGRFVTFVPATQAAAAQAILRAHPIAQAAIRIGQVCDGRAGGVTLNTAMGVRRVLDLPSGEQLPRIC